MEKVRRHNFTKRFSAWFIAALMFLAMQAFCDTEAYAALSDVPDITAQSTLLVDSSRGQVLYSYNANKYTNSMVVNKIMEVLIAVEIGNMSDKPTVSKVAADTPAAQAGVLEVGERYAMSDLRYTIMLTSMNDAAVAVAEHIAGDEAAFVAKMNEKAASLDMKSTNFTNVTGIYDPKQYTTAEDAVKLIRYAIQNQTFNEIFSTKTKLVDIGENGSTKFLTSDNTMFWSANTGVDGGKAGYSGEDTITYITTAMKDNMRLICVTMDSALTSATDDVRKVLGYGFSNYVRSVLAEKNKVFDVITVGGNDVEMITDADVMYVHPIGNSYVKNIEFNITPELELPIAKNTSVGTVRYTLSDDTVIDVSMYPNREILDDTQWYIALYENVMRDSVIKNVIIVLLLLEALLAISKCIIHIKRRKQGG